VILEAIAVVQTANVAIGAIKELIGNGKDLTDCGKELTTYFTAKSKIQLNASSLGSGDDLKLFLSLDKLKQQEYELKQLMIYTGRSGMWDDWIRFQNSQKKQRDNDKQQIALKKASRRKKIVDWTIGIAVAIAALSAIGLCFYILYWVVQTKGK
jgi:hypothetical protein